MLCYYITIHAKVYRMFPFPFPRLWLNLFLAVWAGLTIARAGAAESAEKLDVIASIKPLTLIARDLLGDEARVETLVTGAASPHDYALKVSDMRHLNRADLVLWMGPELERFLEKPLATLDPARVLTLAQDRATTGPEHRHGADPHQWLDPNRAMQMARDLAERLGELFPQRRQVIQQRLQRQLKVYQQLDQELEQALTPVKSMGFVVQHRGYDYFVNAYGLHQLGWLSVSPEQPPGVRHLYELQRALQGRPEDEKARCLFIERAHPSETALNLAGELGLRPQTLDILGESADTYPQLMRQLARDVISCLSAPAPK